MLSEGANRETQSMVHHKDEHDDFGIMLLTAQYYAIDDIIIKIVLLWDYPISFWDIDVYPLIGTN